MGSMAALEDSKACFWANISGGWPGMAAADLYIVDSGIVKNRIIHTSSTEYTLQNISANCRSTDYLVSPQEGCEEITASAQCLSAAADNIWIRDYRCINGLLYGAVSAEQSQKMYWSPWRLRG